MLYHVLSQAQASTLYSLPIPWPSQLLDPQEFIPGEDTISIAIQLIEHGLRGPRLDRAGSRARHV